MRFYFNFGTALANLVGASLVRRHADDKAGALEGAGDRTCEALRSVSDI
jgi:hypothetical protein